MWNNGEEVIYIKVGSAVDLKDWGKRRVSPTEFVEAFLEGIAKQQTTGTFLVSYRGGRPIRIREVNELTP